MEFMPLPAPMRPAPLPLPAMGCMRCMHACACVHAYQLRVQGAKAAHDVLKIIMRQQHVHARALCNNTKQGSRAGPSTFTGPHAGQSQHERLPE